MTEEMMVPEKPEVVVFATFGSAAKYPVKVSMLGEMVSSLVCGNSELEDPCFEGNINRPGKLDRSFR